MKTQKPGMIVTMMMYGVGAIFYFTLFTVVGLVVRLFSNPMAKGFVRHQSTYRHFMNNSR